MVKKCIGVWIISQRTGAYSQSHQVTKKHPYLPSVAYFNLFIIIYFYNSGVPQSLFGARKLTSLIGLSPALDLLITGRLITGVDANRLGLCCKLTSTGTGE